MTTGTGPVLAPPARTWRRTRLAAVIAVVGPGLLAGLSDDDPAGITTYSVLGADHGYRLLWVLLLSTVALVVFHDLGARLGVVTGQGLVGLVRDRYGARPGGAAMAALLVANVGTTCAELVGIAAGSELFGVPRALSVPAAAVLVSVLVLRGSFHRVEHVLMALASVFVAYVVTAFVVGPDWGAVLSGLVLPTTPATRDAAYVIAATVGTTLAPWGLSFIQSYAVDKKLTRVDLRYERADVFVGSVLTGVIGLFVVITCTETLHATGAGIETARDAAVALEPLAGRFAGALFAVGLIGSGLLAAAILPLSTAYSVTDYLGKEGALDDGFRGAPYFYSTYVGVIGVAAAVVLVPGLPLVPVLVLTQVLNAVLLLPLLVLMHLLSRDPEVMAELASGTVGSLAHVAVIALVAVSVTGLLVLSVT